MLEPSEITDDLTRLGIIRGGTWVADARAALSPGHIADLERARARVELAPGVPLLAGDPAACGNDGLREIVQAMISLAGADHEICLCETADADRERGLQFESGLALVFVHAASLRPPFAGLAHEFAHALGLTGIAEIDEGIAMLFDEGATAGAIRWTPKISFDPAWCHALARRQVTPANLYTFGASYFASVVEAQGPEALFAERDRLRQLGSADRVRETMRRHLIAVRAKDQARPVGEISHAVLDDLYFRGYLGAFKAGADAYFATSDPATLSEADQLTFGRYAIYLGTLEAEEVPEPVLQVLQSDADCGLGPPGAKLLAVARAVYTTRRSQSRIALKKSARRLERLLMEACDTPQIAADILLQLVQFHKYVPEIAGGVRDKAALFAAELARQPGMSNVAQELYDGLHRGPA